MKCLKISQNAEKFKSLISPSSSSVLSYNLAHWAGTHSSRPCYLIRRSARACLGSGGSRSQPSDRDSGKPAFMSDALRPELIEPQGVVLQVLTLSGGVRVIAWRLRRLFLGECRQGSKQFLEPTGVCRLLSCA